MLTHTNSLEEARDLVIKRFVEWAKFKNLSPKKALGRHKIYLHPSVPDRWDAVDLVSLSLKVNQREESHD
tara:strand:- start:373 stop:582 length:210 start_codon:yes stop_codon:yes gene_type:complete